MEATDQALEALPVLSRTDFDTGDVLAVGRMHRRVLLEPGAGSQRILDAQRRYLALRQRQIIYGDHTGYGERVSSRIPVSMTSQKQEKLVYSLNCGSGENLREDQVRAAVFARLIVLSRGHSGVRLEIVRCLGDMLNGDRTPAVPCWGSIGASGDLVPSSYVARGVLEELGLEGREALALANGTSFMTGIASLVVEDFAYLHRVSCGLIALLFQCLRGIEDVFDGGLHRLKRHPEQQRAAARFGELVRGSRLLRRIDDLTRKQDTAPSQAEKIQDRYSMRCLAQQLGPIEHRLADARQVITDELNSVSDNPVLIGETVKHGGHFDGSYVADAMDCLKLSIRRLAYILRAYARAITDGKLNHEMLPTYLVAKDPGLNNGVQGLAGLSFDAAYARLVKETIPDSIFALNDHEGANQDVVSLGMHAALSASFAIERLTTLIAMLALVTRQAVKLSGSEEGLSPRTESIYRALANRVPFMEEDRSLHDELRGLENALFNHEL
jgi:phenylalanine ammonia-lyase